MLNTPDSHISSHITQSYLQRILGMNPNELRKLEEDWKCYLHDAKNQVHEQVIRDHISAISEVLLYR